MYPDVVRNSLQDRLISYQPASYTLPQNPAEFLESLETTMANVSTIDTLAQPPDEGTRVSHYHLDYRQVDKNGLDYLFRLIDAPDRGPALFAGFPFNATMNPGAISLLIHGQDGIGVMGNEIRGAIGRNRNSVISAIHKLNHHEYYSEYPPTSPQMEEE